ncbi:molybdopterin oxidoreductase family protein [Nocardia sp. NRRL S-836]|uniref:molybdopterin oxidoreductase family protein n=1 Tax=Nocardia sp. NRRL S-836 TaxID=1519492 RepID=UPI0006B01A42|nr:nitrate reductase [Nocardia sp. NRRL S-836]
MNRIADVWGPRTPHGRGSDWPARVDLELADGVTESDVDRWVPSACVLCSNGCGCDIAVKDGRMVGVRGRADDPVNRGRLGPKGLYGSWQAHRTDRLTRPRIRRGGELVETDWDTAMGEVVRRSRELLAESGPLSHGFYTSGQLFLEEYYTLGVIGKAGIGTPHMDGNTRLCTATAAAALKETFGSDGQPACHADVDLTDALFLFGHNMAATQTVLWARVLDRLDGPDRPRLVVVDPRRTPVAERADVHLAPLPGTNQALLNGLVRAVIEHDWVDHDYVAAHTLGFEELKATVEPYTPEHVARICGISPADLLRAAEIFGTTGRVLSTVLQGFYQSHQATAASCQVNNLHLLRGLIGRPGSGVLQMNGQPTAQNTRECGANGDLPGFRNWDNPEHVEQLARLWNVDPLVIPHWAPPTHAMQIWRYAEQGSIRFLWISATNPAVSLPELARIRDILRRDDLFVVVQDGFPTETTELADVVLPAALWGEKQGTFTNATRVVHLSEQAVQPPGEARSDLDIFLDYARRMDFRDRDGAPLIKWKDAEGAFDAWRECSRGRPCDYTELSYAKLREGGIPWGGKERLYADSHFPTAADHCEDFGHDLLTGASVTPVEYRARRPDGRAFLKAVEYTPAPEQLSDDYPLLCTTGRSVYHFHTRTKTGRAPKLQQAAPDPWVEVSSADADALGLAEGDLVCVESERGAIEVPVRIGRCRPGVVFVPFHYGFQAANELTRTTWDPVSKQPVFKISAVRIRKV